MRSAEIAGYQLIIRLLDAVYRAPIRHLPWACQLRRDQKQVYCSTYHWCAREHRDQLMIIRLAKTIDSCWYHRHNHKSSRLFARLLVCWLALHRTNYFPCVHENQNQTGIAHCNRAGGTSNNIYGSGLWIKAAGCSLRVTGNINFFNISKRHIKYTYRNWDAINIIIYQRKYQSRRQTDAVHRYCIGKKQPRIRIIYIGNLLDKRTGVVHICFHSRITANFTDRKWDFLNFVKWLIRVQNYRPKSRPV